MPALAIIQVVLPLISQLLQLLGQGHPAAPAVSQAAQQLHLAAAEMHKAP